MSSHFSGKKTGLTFLRDFTVLKKDPVVYIMIRGKTGLSTKKESDRWQYTRRVNGID